MESTIPAFLCRQGPASGPQTQDCLSWGQQAGSCGGGQHDVPLRWGTAGLSLRWGADFLVGLTAQGAPPKVAKNESLSNAWEVSLAAD